MKKVAVAICDDVYDDAVLLGDHLKKLLPEAEINIFQKGEELIDAISKADEQILLIFLDIIMPEMDGIQVAMEIRRRCMNVPIIFVTGSEDYYRQAFDVFAYQYLLKPVEIQKLEEILTSLKYGWNDKDESVIHFRYRSQLHTLKRNQVSYISSSLHTVTFHLSDGTSVHCRGKLNDFDEQLKNSSFLRCHQSFYVNMDAVIGMKTDSFILENAIVPISRSYAKDAQKLYYQYINK